MDDLSLFLHRSSRCRSHQCPRNSLEHKTMTPSASCPYPNGCSEIGTCCGHCHHQSSLEQSLVNGVVLLAFVLGILLVWWILG